jgi:hypothetical protein
MKRTITGGVMAAMAFTLVACGSSTPAAVKTVTVSATPTTTTPAPTTTPPITTPPAPDMTQCSNMNKEADPAMRAAFDALPPNPLIRLVSTQTVTDSDEPGMVAAIFYLCAPGMKDKALKDFATEIARQLKATPFADTVFSMSVHNYFGKETVGKVKCRDFQLHTFSAEADPGAVRASWETLPN